MTDSRFEDPIEARKKAMDYLARREHSRVELLDKLTRSGFDPDIADTAVAGLIEDQLQSDSRYADAFVSSRINQGKGPLKIRAELRERGITASMIEIALEDADTDWYAAASAVRVKKFGAQLPTDFNTKARQIRFLQSRGFDSDHIRAAVAD